MYGGGQNRERERDVGPTYSLSLVPIHHSLLTTALASQLLNLHALFLYFLLGPLSDRPQVVNGLFYISGFYLEVWLAGSEYVNSGLY